MNVNIKKSLNAIFIFAGSTRTGKMGLKRSEEQE